MLLALLAALTVGLVGAQADDAIEPVLVTVEAEDGLTLRGAYFDASGGDGPAVLLLHQLYTTRHSWNPLIQSLMESGYKVLAVDLRGYGRTRGAISWGKAQTDTVIWAEWLEAQPGVKSVALIGSSMGANLALNGCAAFDGCQGAVSLSPGLNYFGVRIGDAISAGFPALIVYADGDRYPSRDVPALAEAGGSKVSVQVYEGRDHGMDLFEAHDDLTGVIIDWLNDHR
jgi:alpha-beta hydrolase superfamily lysophospholipase